MCQLCTAFYPNEKISSCLYTLLINSAYQIKSNHSYEVKLQIHIVVYNLKNTLWAICTLSMEKIKKRDVYRRPMKMIRPTKMILRPLFNPYICQMHVKLIEGILYIPATMELTNNNPTLTLHKCILGLNLIYKKNYGLPTPAVIKHN